MEGLEVCAILFSTILEVKENSECLGVDERKILKWSLEICYV
jgi:hypothetical protein